MRRWALAAIATRGRFRHTRAQRMGTLYHGDNLNIRYIADESIDLVYLDPPFNSPRTPTNRNLSMRNATLPVLRE